MTSDHIEIGEPLPGGDVRNPGGWILLLALAGLMIFTQLVSYFGRSTNSDFLVTKVEQQLKFQVASNSLTGTGKSKTVLDSLATQLRPHLDEPKVAELYAAVRKESGEAATPKELTVLKASTDPVEKAIYTLFTQPKATKDEVRKLVEAIPQDDFRYRLIRVQAFESAGISPSGRDDLQSTNTMLRAGLAGLLLLGGVLLGLLVLVGFIVARGGGYLKPLGFPTGDISLPDADRLVMRSAQIFVSFLAIGLLGGLLLRNAGLKELGSLPIYFAIVAIVLLLAKVPVADKWITLKKIGISRENLGKHVLWGVGAALANVPILVVLMLVSTALSKGLPAPEHPTTVQLSTTSSPWVVIVSIVMAAVMAPIIEEILFRGTMFPGFSRALKSPVWGAVTTSFLFAAIHPTGIPAWPALAGIGAMSCALVYHTKSLVPSMVMHATHNFATLVIVLLTTH